MSDNWLRFVPSDPAFQPTPEAAGAAATLLRSFVPSAQHVEARFLDEITFIDAGSNGLEVGCSACGKDAGAWWSDAMSSAWEHGFHDLATNAPCCGARVSLNELHYDRPVAFGRFVLEAMNPSVADVSADQNSQLAASLGCPMRIVWTRF